MPIKKEENNAIAFRSPAEIIHIVQEEEIIHPRIITLHNGRFSLLLPTQGQVEYLRQVSQKAPALAEETTRRLRLVRSKVILAIKGDPFHNFEEKSCNGERESALFRYVKKIMGLELTSRPIKEALFMEKRRPKFHYLPRSNNLHNLKRWVACLNALIIACIGELSVEELTESIRLKIPEEWYSQKDESAMPAQYQWDELTKTPAHITDPSPNEDLYFPGTEEGEFHVPGIEKAKKAISTIGDKETLSIWRRQVIAAKKLLLTRKNPHFIPQERRNHLIDRFGRPAKILSNANINMPSSREIMAQNDKESEGKTYQVIRGRLHDGAERRHCLVPLIPLSTQNRIMFGRLAIRLDLLDTLLEEAVTKLSKSNTYVTLGSQKIPLQSQQQRESLKVLHTDHPEYHIAGHTLSKAWTLIRKVVLLFQAPIKRFYEESEIVDRATAGKHCRVAWEENAFGYGIIWQEKTLWAKHTKTVESKKSVTYSPKKEVMDSPDEIRAYLSNLFALVETFGETKESLQSALTNLNDQSTPEAQIIKQKLWLMKIHEQLKSQWKKSLSPASSIRKKKKVAPKNESGKSATSPTSPSRKGRKTAKRTPENSRKKTQKEKKKQVGNRTSMNPERRAMLLQMAGQEVGGAVADMMERAVSLLGYKITSNEDARDFLIALRPDEKKTIRKAYKTKVELSDIARRDKEMIRRWLGVRR